MKACRVRTFGPPDVISVEEIDRPEPAPGEVLVEVKASGVGPWDSWVRSGKSVLPQPLPLTLGADLSGVVVALGPETRDFAVGDEVYGVTNARFTGANAEYAEATAAMLARKPGRLSHSEAAAVPVVAVTALQMLFDHGGLQPNQRVLVHGAGGNVGAYAVQLARESGATVIASDIAAGLPYVATLGPRQIVDATAHRFEEEVEPVDLVIDTVGGNVQARSFEVLRPGGILVSSVSKPDADAAKRRGVRAAFMLVDVKTAALERLAAMLDAGSLRPQIGVVMPLTEARKAHEMLDGLRPRPPGKIVLTTNEPGSSGINR